MKARALLSGLLILLLFYSTDGQHLHDWDDLRVLDIEVTNTDKDGISWEHKGRVEVRYGYWSYAPGLQQNATVKLSRIKVGDAFIAIYCGVCRTVVGLYDDPRGSKKE